MKIYKNILIALDLSEKSWHAFLEALKILQEKDTQGVILTVVPRFTRYLGHSGDIDLTHIDNLQDRIYAPYMELKKKVQQVLKERNITTVKIVLEEGEEPYQKILDTAYTNNCDLIVMGRTSGKARTYFIGSTTARVIGNSPIDVLVVPYTKSINFNKILVAVDGSSFAEKAFYKALVLAKEHQSQLFVLSVEDIPVEIYEYAPEIGERALEKRCMYIETLVKKANEEGVKSEGMVRSGPPSDKIVEIAKKIQADLLVMGTYGRTGVKRLLMGSTTERVLLLRAFPVLVVK